MCGLKLLFLDLELTERVVTPCVGVWIETEYISVVLTDVWSHPAWVCGLKQALFSNS